MCGTPMSRCQCRSCWTGCFNHTMNSFYHTWQWNL